MVSPIGLIALPLFLLVAAHPYRQDLVDYNLNVKQGASSVLDYDSSRPSGKYTPSPKNWRELPFYTVLLDKFADGDPRNNDFFKTTFENDPRETNLRFGGDVKGLQRRLDYLQGMGIRAVFIAGTPFVNMPWQADSYSALDFTLLDPHWGTLEDWRSLIDDIHARGMYIMLDFTVGTMGDFIGFKDHINISTPFSTNEYDAVWKKPLYTPWGLEEYADFKITNSRNSSCVLPTLWTDEGQIIDVQVNGCYASEFDQYGDMEAFGVHPDWQRQLSKFASVQDRLREWHPAVMAKLQKFPCLIIKALDIDAIRIDKATQVTLDALAAWTTATHTCAKELGKDNFFIPGEVTGGDRFASLYIGRGRTTTRLPPSFLDAANVTQSQAQFFLREPQQIALDGVAFHYSIYRALNRFLGMDGNLQVAYDIDVNFVTAWNQMFVNNDFLNKETDAVDPRHMYGVTNFDVFRWPGLVNGTQRQLLGTFITTLVMPGIPLFYYGEEQNFYIFDNGASNYLFGRQPMSSSLAWQRHGCYKLGSEQYFNVPLEKALLGCEDDWNSLDHFDPTANTRRMMTHFNYLRTMYPTLQDGFNLIQWGNWTYRVEYPGSNHTQTELGMWSVTRAAISQIQAFTGPRTEQVWMLYTNENSTKTYSFDCLSKEWISSPYVSSTVIRNLFYPFENYTLQDSGQGFLRPNESPWRGCLREVTLDPYSFKAFVPIDLWVPPRPALTRFLPGHDSRIKSQKDGANATAVPISLEFNVEMNCEGITNALSISYSSSGHGGPPTFDKAAVVCASVGATEPPDLPGDMPSVWSWSTTLTDVPDGIISLTLTDCPVQGSTATSNAVDRLIFRKGSPKNVMVFPNADYDNEAFSFSNGQYTFTHKAFGAELFRYSCNYGFNFTDWAAWEDVTIIPASCFSGPEHWWEGQHVIVQYWAEVAASVTHVVHADRGYPLERRVPQVLARGPFNTWGYDRGIPAKMNHNARGQWELEIMSSWPTYVQLNVFGFDDYFYGDTDGDGVMERLPPNSAAPNYLNMSAPPLPHLAWALLVDDATGRWSLEPRGHSIIGAIMFALLLIIPIATAVAAVLIFRCSFYGIRHNKWGVKPAKNSHNYFPIIGKGEKAAPSTPLTEKIFGDHKFTGPIIGWPEDANKRRKVLIATLEYEILDWKLKVKIGGLGVMSTLMGKAMTDVDLVWVVPKVKDIEYPTGDLAEPIEVTIFEQLYLIEVETHQLDNITYVLLDSPVFRAHTKADPYPKRMDDLSSAIFYSTWNQAIAATIRRYPVIDIYHINDYHGALAPLYLLPKVIPVCLSLHNAEFQGLWPLRTKQEMIEVCSAFNLSNEICVKYVQFCNTFNLLHAAASYISVHQKSVGAAGVSEKYGKRSWARYPALWTLKHVDPLPNPDPSDIAALDEKPLAVADVKIDQAAEALRPELKRQAQEWAGIKQDPHSDLFVFVGRWSKQKGVDLIADVMPSLLEKRPSIQLICVGPVIDLYGRFAAEKLARLMEMYPERIYSKPEFTALPPFLFSGADFALIPSRDEPFGLVAVEFGRKGALGVGSRLGGLGLMPGWWFPVESSATSHMLSQLTKTIKLALKSTEEERAILRARSAIQRFPVVEWRQRMEDFHKRSISTSRAIAGDNSWRASDCDPLASDIMAGLGFEDWNTEYLADPDWDSRSVMTGTGSPKLPVTPPTQDIQFLRAASYGRSISAGSDASENEDYFTSRGMNVAQVGEQVEAYGDFLARANRQIAREQRHIGDPFLDVNALPNRPFGGHSRISSVESIASIVDEKVNSPLNTAMASFTDADGEVAQAFVSRLQFLSADNSRTDLSIEKFLVKSEEAFFSQIRKNKISIAASIRSSHHESVWTPAPSSFDSRPPSPSIFSSNAAAFNTSDYNGPLAHYTEAVPMTRLQIAMSREVKGWPVYTIILAIGQLMGATSFQITLLSGHNYVGDLDLYVLGAVFLLASVVWYTLFRMKPSVYVLSLPWLFYGIAFFLVGLPNLADFFNPVQKYMKGGATWSYAVASAAAFLFFGLNFGEEAGVATEVWILRACVVQGTQQVWVAALWYWGYELNGSLPGNKAPWWVVLILWPLAIMSFVFAYCMLYGLPDYYRQVPPKVPNFIRTLFRRKLVVWFLASEVLRDYWLSGPYGRNWSFLWNTRVPQWATLLLVFTFFIGVWTLMLWVLTYFSKTHTWLLPVFAVGLGAPRWCQMMWGTSSLALYIPWAGGAGPYLGTSLWLWLGVLDAVQGVGLGMILLQTLSRLHVCATLAFSQILGCICVMVARATAPNAIGPGTVFPDASTWDFQNGLEGSPMASAPFWVALICQIIVVVGYFWFYRKEQLSRP